VRLRLQETLVVTGERDQLVMSGAASSWHDLALFLIARVLGPATAQAVAKFYAFQWHAEGLAPYAVFEPRTDHGDAVVLRAQTWLAEHLAADSPVEEMARRSALPERSFKRRFRKATGHSPIAYVQRLRVERAKNRLETTEDPVERIGWSVGYVDTSSFRRLFSRIVGMPPGAYRRKFQLPDFSR
jgi:transcriptional regulator GlxA family with amidase domain